MSLKKENAAMAALELVEDGMTLGLGSGSTAEIFIERLGERVAGGLKVVGVPTSKNTAKCARSNRVPLVDLDFVDKIDLTIDGADEVDPVFNLIKGGGACLLREKIIAQASERMAVIIDSAKMVETLGAFPLPIEVDPFGMALTAQQIYQALKDTDCKNGQTSLRQARLDKVPLITDGGHYILDCKCEIIPDPVATAHALNQIAGVMEHGIFVDIADMIIVGEDDHAKIMELSRA